MSNRIFIQDTTLIELGRGAGLSLWGFRASAQGKAACPCIQKGFQNVFGQQGAHILDCLRFFAHNVGFVGGRKVGLAAPGHVHITRDEASILASIGAAQVGDEVSRDAHLAWLLAGPAPHSLASAVNEIAYGFAESQLTVASPEYEQPALRSASRLKLVAVAAH